MGAATSLTPACAAEGPSGPVCPARHFTSSTRPIAPSSISVLTLRAAGDHLFDKSHLFAGLTEYLAQRLLKSRGETKTVLIGHNYDLQFG